jgi:erythrin-vacuolar iron transport family protein
MIPGLSNRRRFSDLTEQEILALAISSEEDDARIYRSYAERLRGEFPASAAIFDGMAAEEDQHRQRLIDLHRTRFGDVIPLIRREHVAGHYARKPIWLTQNLRSTPSAARPRDGAGSPALLHPRRSIDTVDAATRKLLGDLAAAEAGHERKAGTCATSTSPMMPAAPRTPPPAASSS